MPKASVILGKSRSTLKTQLERMRIKARCSNLEMLDAALLAAARCAYAMGRAAGD